MSTIWMKLIKKLMISWQGLSDDEEEEEEEEDEEIENQNQIMMMKKSMSNQPMDMIHLSGCL